MSRWKRLRSLVARQMAAVLITTAGLVVVSAAPAHALYEYHQGFETRDDIGWFWGLTGQGSGEWYTDKCALARTGCGGVLLTHAPTGWATLFTTVHLSALNYGWCSIGYYARRWNSPAPPTARLEVLRPDGTYISLSDQTLTGSAWTYVGTGFYHSAARDVKIRMTLPGSSAGNVGIDLDDLTVNCRVLVQGRG